MNLSVLVPPAVEPVTLEQALLELRVGADEPDAAAVADKLAAAREDCEAFTGRAFVTQTLRLSLSASDWRGFIELPRPPIISVESVSYYDANNALQVIDPASYYAPSIPGVAFVTGYSMPAFYGRQDALQIDYVAGYPPLASADPEDPQYLASGVPKTIGQAVLLTLRLLFQKLELNDREATQRTRDNLLWPHKVLRV